ncbi:methyltransferase domain-containing protein [Saxibacter everestensis]|uniref:Methyltransferase domain-containing protein n=1 Tax=Saxibacter everestensis TaxID=2909229 RepID=A0ABY8QQN9_9MICO|nr:methyltransferase domain-containing protein [Brevibacteriaceae bacterium ZFBP1038]
MDFDSLASEVFRFEGWDFSAFEGRIFEEPTPWDYPALVASAARQAAAMADMGTGGGEFFKELLEELGTQSPQYVTATESWEPNLPVARTRLAPLGVNVVAFTDDSRLPFRDNELDLVVNKHESFDPTEVKRVLQPDGRFLTQQVGGRDLSEINARLGAQPLDYSDWTLEAAVDGLRAAGFVIEKAEEALIDTWFGDVGALVGFLQVIDWQVPNFSVDAYRDQLRRIHEEILADGPLLAQAHRFLIQAHS